jgi:hypothetical protein
MRPFSHDHHSSLQSWHAATSNNFPLFMTQETSMLLFFQQTKTKEQRKKRSYSKEFTAKHMKKTAYVQSVHKRKPQSDE